MEVKKGDGPKSVDSQISPQKSSKPSQPVQFSKIVSSKPSKPADSSDPSQSVQSSKPTDSSKPSQPDSQTQPAKNSVSNNPIAPSKPADSSDPSRSAQPSKPQQNSSLLWIIPIFIGLLLLVIAVIVLAIIYSPNNDLEETAPVLISDCGLIKGEDIKYLTSDSEPSPEIKEKFDCMTENLQLCNPSNLRLDDGEGSLVSLAILESSPDKCTVMINTSKSSKNLPTELSCDFNKNRLDYYYLNDVSEEDSWSASFQVYFSMALKLAFWNESQSDIKGPSNANEIIATCSAYGGSSSKKTTIFSRSSGWASSSGSSSDDGDDDDDDECSDECSSAGCEGNIPYGCYLESDGCYDKVVRTSCSADQICSAGSCLPLSCVPNCTGKECGSDGCGGSCSPGCSDYETCNSDECIESDCIILNQKNQVYTMDSDEACFVILAQNVTLDCNGYTISNDLYETGVYSNYSYLTIKNCIFGDLPYALEIEDSSYNVLDNLAVTGETSYGSAIFLDNVSNSVISNIEIDTETPYYSDGLELYHSDGNNLTNIYINSTYFGLYIYGSNNRVTNLISENNYYGLYSIGENTFRNSIVRNNNYYDYYPSDCDASIENVTVSRGLSLGYFNTSVNLKDKEFSELIICNASFSNLTNLVVKGNQTLRNNGLFIIDSDSVNLSGITSSNNYKGIFLDYSNDFFLKNITVNNNRDSGLSIYAYNGVINGVVANNNTYGIDLDGDWINISNALVNRNRRGIYLYGDYNIFNNITGDYNNYGFHNPNYYSNEMTNLMENSRFRGNLYFDVYSFCTTDFVNVYISDDEPLPFYKGSFKLEDEQFSELIICNAINSNISNIDLLGGTLSNNGMIIYNMVGSHLSNILISNKYENLISESGENVFDNIAVFNSTYGLFLEDSHRNNFSDLTISNSKSEGLYSDGDGNNFKNILLTNNTYGLEIDGDSNSINNLLAKDNYLGVELGGRYNLLNNISVTNSTSGVYLSYGKNNSLTDLNVSNGYYGLEIDGDNNSLINITTDYNEGFGVLLYGFSNTLNNLSAAENYIGLDVNSDFNFISNSVFYNNTFGGYISGNGNILTQILSINNTYGLYFISSENIIAGSISCNNLEDIYCSEDQGSFENNACLGSCGNVSCTESCSAYSVGITGNVVYSKEYPLFSSFIDLLERL